MIITRTPFRISLFGGGSDYPEWYRENGGAILGFAIDKYCYISVRSIPPFFEHKHRIVYSEVENVAEISEIQHPSVRAVLEDQNVTLGLEIHHDGDLPARSGLGSSSSFTVGLIHAIKAMNGQLMGCKKLAEEAIRIEHDVIKECVGIQDQIWSSFGGFNRIKIIEDGDFDVQPVILSSSRRTELFGSLMLFFTGISRFAPEVAKEKVNNMKNCSKNIERMVFMVDEGLDILQSPKSINDIGRLLHESWMLKRELAGGVATPTVDEIYQVARGAGAIGGKLLGAGGGGFMVFFVEPEFQDKVREKLSSLVEVKFDVDKTGSKVVVYEPSGLENR